jgi:hypothetical protein
MAMDNQKKHCAMHALHNKKFSGRQLLRVGHAEGVRSALINCIETTTKDQHAAMCEELIASVAQKHMESLGFPLLPFAKAVEYWRKGKDEEVLDRLNPEVREIVEAIIRGDRSPKTEN